MGKAEILGNETTVFVGRFSISIAILLRKSIIPTGKIQITFNFVISINDEYD